MKKKKKIIQLNIEVSIIICKIFYEKLRNQAKLDKTKELTYLLSIIFRVPVTKKCFW